MWKALGLHLLLRLVALTLSTDQELPWQPRSNGADGGSGAAACVWLSCPGTEDEGGLGDRPQEHNELWRQEHK